MTTSRKLTILQLNDLHGYLEPHPEVFRGAGEFTYRSCGGLARIATYFKQVRTENPGAVLALDNGDTFHGTYAAVQSRGESMLPLTNALGFDAMTLHWEFAYGPDRVRQMSAGLRYPMLACNCYDKASGSLVFPPTAVVERAGLRVGIVGVACHIVDKTMPASYSEGVRFTLGNEELPGHIDYLRSNERVDLVVVLSHLGFAQDAKLAAQVPGIDILVSGHTHNRLYEPVWIGRTPIIQSGCHGSFIGRLDVTLEAGKVADVRHALVPMDERVPEEAQMKEAVDAVMEPHRDFLDQLVGHAASPLDRATSLEASMDNVLLDAIAAAAGSEIAFSNGWRYGAPILPGPVSMEQLWNIVPTQPPVSTVEITGEELQAMLEANLERTYSADPYCQMGGYVKRCRGLNMYFKPENPKGYRIEELLVEGAPVQRNRVYLAAMLGEQGVPAKYGNARHKLPIDAIEALQRWFAAGRQVEGRRRGSIVAV